MLMKFLWRICKYPNLLICKTLKAKYFRAKSVLEVEKKESDSYGWKSICSVMKIFKGGLSTTVADPSNWKWGKSATGEYSVKDGYQYAFRWKLAKGAYYGESSDSSQRQKLWQRIWRIRVPDRVKIHVWRMFHRALPVFQELNKRGCASSNGCCFCGYRCESSEHLFIQCWWSKAFWRRLEVNDAPEEVQYDVSQWLWHYACGGDTNMFRLIVIGAWVLWGNRNSWVHGSRGRSIEECVSVVRNYMVMFERRTVLGNPIEMDSGILLRDKWTVFCDGAWHKASGDGGFAAVALKDGLVYACRLGWLKDCASPREAEMRGLLAGVELANQLDVREAEIVSDSIEAVWSICNGLGSEAQGWDALHEGFLAFAQNPGWIVRHIFRERNFFADALAKGARDHRWIWDRSDAVPRFVADIWCMALQCLHFQLV